MEHEFREDDGIDSIGGIEGVDIIKLQIGEGDKLSRSQLRLAVETSINYPNYLLRAVPARVAVSEEKN